MRIGRIARGILIALVLCLLPAAALAHWCPDIYEPFHIYLDPGDVMDASQYTHAYFIVTKPGTYTVKGNSKGVLLRVVPESAGEYKVVLDSCTLTPDWYKAPGWGNRPAVEIGEYPGATVILSSKGTNTFKPTNKGISGSNEPAISKNGTVTRLEFRTEDPNDPGTIIADASGDVGFVPGIGCGNTYSAGISYPTTGNIHFISGKIRAYGSNGTSATSGGPGIGAGGGGIVDGLYFSGAEVEAYAGDCTGAGIGTASAWTIHLAANDKPLDHVTAKNIVISGGTVKAGHSNYDWHFLVDASECGAGIGGGAYANANGIRITGGTVYAESARSAAAIGGGAGADGLDIRISGGNITAVGGSAGIGSGLARGAREEAEIITGDGAGGGNQFFGDCTVTVSGGTVTARGGYDGTDFTVDGTGIGCSKMKYSKSKIEVSGGSITAIGCGEAAGIGTNLYGHLKQIKITGGIIFARGGSHRSDQTSDGMGIGTVNGFRESNALINNEDRYPNRCDLIIINGGTVLAASGAHGSVPDIGGYTRHMTKTRISMTPIRITGGNVCGTLTTTADNGRGQNVYANVILPEDFGLGTKAPTGAHAVTSLDIEGSSDYGLNDTCLVGNDHTDVYERNLLCVYLPEGSSVKGVHTDPALIIGKSSVTAETNSFYGITEAGKGGNVYPPVFFKLEENGSAIAAIGEDHTETMDPPNVPYRHIDAWQSDAGRLLEASGSFDAGVNGYTDSSGVLTAIRGTYTREDYVNGVQLRAITSKGAYSIAFNGNRPSNASTTLSGDTAAMSSVGFGDDVQLTRNGFALPGYTFDSWNTRADGRGKKYDDGQSVRDLTDVDGEIIPLYAIWTPKQYTITLCADDGSGQTTPLTAVFDRPIRLPSEDPFGGEGRALSGWRTIALGSMYAPGESVTGHVHPGENGEIGEVLFYAVWAEAGSLTVTVHVDCAAPDPAVLSGVCLRDGAGTVYRLTETGSGSGIYSAANGSIPAGTYTVIAEGLPQDHPNRVVSIGSGSVSVLLDHFTVAAIATPGVSQTVTVGGTSYQPGQASIVAAGGSVQIGAEALPGYSFAGWTAYQGTPNWTDPAVAVQAISVTEPLRFGATAVPNHYTIRFVPNSPVGNGSMDEIQLAYGSAEQLTPCAFNRPGYSFTGWNTNGDGSGTAFADGAFVQNLSVTDGAVVDLYAQWQADPYTLTFDANGGSGSMSDMIGTHGTALALPKCSYTRSGFHFLGWSLNENYVPGSDPIWTDKSAFLPTDDTQSVVTLYAVWSEYTYYVRLSPGEVEGSVTVFNVPCSTGFVLPEFAAAPDDMIFLNWNTAADGEGQAMQPGDTLPAGSDGQAITMYAQWRVREYRIIEGDGSIWTRGSTEPLRFRANGALKEFTALLIDGEVVPKEGYTVESGSTIAWIRPELLSRMKLGSHTLKMTYKYGETNTARFTVVDVPPKTGDTNRPVLWILMCVSAMIVMILCLRRRDG